MFEHVARIDGPFAGVDTLFVVLGLVLLVAVLAVTALVARQVAAMTPKPALGASKAGSAEAAKAGAEFESWTEKPAAERNYETDYYSIYGTAPANRGDYVGPNAPAAPPTPATRGRNVTVNLTSPPGSQTAPASPWDPASAEWARTPPRAQAQMAPPPEPTGPTDEVVAPSHSRSARTASPSPWQDLPNTRPGGALAPAPPLPKVERGQPAARPPPPASVAPAPTARPGSARSTFGASQANQSVVGTADFGAKEGAQVGAERKAIRCPKCSTVFPGPATRPAMVKCPACGTGGMMK